MKKNKLTVLAYIFMLAIFTGGCAGGKVSSGGQSGSSPVDYISPLDATASWRALQRFASKNGYRFVKMESDQGIMEITEDGTYSGGYSTYYMHYEFLVIGLAQGTKIQIDTGFYDNNGKEVKVSGSLEKIRAEKNAQLYKEVKAFMEPQRENR